VPEELGHHAEASGQGEAWGAVAVAVGLQVLLATGAVGGALLIELLLLRLPQLRRGLRLPREAVPALPVRAQRAGRVIGGVRGRGPPVSVTP
jgi:hypothetical protein